MTDTTAAGPEVRHTTREGWLTAAVVAMAPWLKEVALDLDPAIAPAMCGWAKGQRDGKNTIGVCYHPKTTPAQPQLRAIFISPEIEMPIEVLATVLHEMVHAALPPEVGHKKAFKDAVYGLGLVGKATATYCEVESALFHRFTRLYLDVLGPYPHSKMVGGLKKTKKSKGWPRYTSTTEDTYRVLISPKMVEKFGAPVDPWGEEMVPVGEEEGGED